MRIAMIGQKGLEIGERGGGIEMHVAELSKQLAERGHEVTVYGRRRYVNGDKGGQKMTGAKEVVVRLVPTIYTKHLEAIVHTILCTADALFQPYDIIHYHGVGPATIAWIPRLLKPSARVVATFHSQDRFQTKWGWFARMYLWFGEFATCWFPHATIAVSHILQVYARDTIHRQIVYIPNGATVQDVRAIDRLKEFDLEPRKYILNVSRLVPHKGQKYLIEAWKRLKTETGDKGQGTGDGMKLVFVGAGTYTDAYVRELHAEAAKDEGILFLGYQTGEALRQVFSHAYLYVQPSESEGLPVAVLEAMSFGVPVLASDIPENLEAMHHAGFSFRRRDFVDLAAKLKELIHSPKTVLQASRRVRDVVAAHFNWSVIARETEEVYRSVRH